MGLHIILGWPCPRCKGWKTVLQSEAGLSMQHYSGAMELHIIFRWPCPRCKGRELYYKVKPAFLCITTLKQINSDQQITITFFTWRQLQGIVMNPVYTDFHTFSAFWLRSSVVSVLISVKAGFRFLADVFFTFIFELPDCAACRQRLGRSPGAFTFPPWGQQNFRFHFFILMYFYVYASFKYHRP